MTFPPFEYLKITIIFLCASHISQIASRNVTNIKKSKDCYCSCRQSGSLLLLRCLSGNSKSVDQTKAFACPVQCHHMGTSIRIGGITGAHENGLRSSQSKLQISIDTYGFSGLNLIGAPDSASTLQLDLPISGKLIDALAFAGLSGLKVLSARKYSISLEACSLAGLNSLEKIILNCSSIMDSFISFGPNVRTFRLVGCLGLPLQFMCTQCKQHPQRYILRILQGPPLLQSMVTFSNGDMSLPDYEKFDGKSILIGRCTSAFCSDEHLCRFDYSLKLSNIFRRSGMGLNFSEYKYDASSSNISEDYWELLKTNNKVLANQNKSWEKEHESIYVNETNTWHSHRIITIFLITMVATVLIIVAIVVCICLSLNVMKAFVPSHIFPRPRFLSNEDQLNSAQRHTCNKA